MSSLETLHDLYIHELKDLHSAEKQLTVALPKMEKAANSPKLKKAFASHLKETKSQLERVQQILTDLGEKPGATKCLAMQGLVEEGAKMVSEKATPEVKDAGLIAAAQRVEHYEIAGYGTARAYARALGEEAAVATLSEILQEEASANDKLNELALNEINEKACAAC